MAIEDAGNEGEIQVKMVLSADDFARVLERMGFAPDQAAGIAAGGGEDRARGRPVNLEKSIRTSPTFMSIFKPVAALAGINLGIQGILASSRVAQTYLGAMGKMFGAAVDLLLMPFIPLFNLLMVGMGMLVKWLVTSGVLEKISQGVLDFLDFVKNDIAPPLKEMWAALQAWDWEKVAAAMGDILWAIGTKIVEKVDEKLGGPGQKAQQWFEKIPIVGDQGERLTAGAQQLLGEVALRASPLGSLKSTQQVIGGFGGAAQQIFKGRLPTPEQLWSMAETTPTLAPVAVGRHALGAVAGAGAGRAQERQYEAARQYTSNWNITINEARDPMAIKRELEAYDNSMLAKYGWQGK